MKNLTNKGRGKKGWGVVSVLALIVGVLVSGVPTAQSQSGFFSWRPTKPTQNQCPAQCPAGPMGPQGPAGQTNIYFVSGKVRFLCPPDITTTDDTTKKCYMADLEPPYTIAESRGLPDPDFPACRDGDLRITIGRKIFDNNRWLNVPVAYVPDCMQFTEGGYVLLPECVERFEESIQNYVPTEFIQYTMCIKKEAILNQLNP